METMQPTTTYRGILPVNGAESARKEGLMAFSNISTFESQVREFAAEFPTPNVQRAVALCEAGTLTWEQVAKVFRDSLATGLQAVGA